MTRALLFDAPGPPGPPGPRGLAGSAGADGATSQTAGLNGTASAGQALVTNGANLTSATTGALASALTHAGLALSVGPTGVKYLSQGPFPFNIKNLGAGLACAVGTDASGNPVRVTDAACVSGLKYLGVCDANGAIYVSPRNADYIDVRDFGLVGDNSTDNTAAWAAMMSVITNGDTFAPTARAEIRFSTGLFKFSSLAAGQALQITRCCRISGPGMGALADTAPAALIFQQGRGGFVLMNNATSIVSSFSQIEDLALYGSNSVGNNVRPSAWTRSHAYNVGDVIMPRYYETISSLYSGGLMAWAFVCTAAGTSGSTEPTWPTPVPPITDTFVTDGGATWKLIAAHGIELRQGFVKISRVRCYGFAGNGVHGVASSSWGTGWAANTSVIEDCDLSYNGGNGLALGGFDGNAIRCSGNSCRHNRGFGTHDRSAIGNVHVGGQNSGNIIGGWYGNTSTFVQPYSESGSLDTFAAAAVLIGGIVALSGDYTPLRQNAHAYALNDYIRPVATSNFVFICVQAGTSAGSEPDFSTLNGSPMVPSWNDDVQATITDGTVKWVCFGTQDASDGLILGRPGYPGVRPIVVDEQTGAVTVQAGLGQRSTTIDDGLSPLVAQSLASSDDSAFANKFFLALDPTNNRFYWTYTTGAGNRFMEFTRAGATPEGQGNVNFPKGIFIGDRATDPNVFSFYGPNLMRFAGGVDAHGGHYLGDEGATRDGVITTDATLTVAHTFALPDDATNGALTEVNVKVLAKGIGAGSECAVFFIRGSWFRKSSSVTQVAAPEVVYGEPTDAMHCTSGATAWTAVLVLSGTDVLVKVTGAASTQIHWYATIASSEGTRT